MEDAEKIKGHESDEIEDADDTLAQAVKAVESALQRWPEQYKRMLRWRARLEAPLQDEEHRRDDFYSFFVAAHHLADWIKTDDAVPTGPSVTPAWTFRHAGSIGLAGDVTNGFKHLKRQPGRENVDAGAHVSVTPAGCSSSSTRRSSTSRSSAPSS